MNENIYKNNSKHKKNNNIINSNKKFNKKF